MAVYSTPFLALLSYGYLQGFFCKGVTSVHGEVATANVSASVGSETAGGWGVRAKHQCQNKNEGLLFFRTTQTERKKISEIY